MYSAGQNTPVAPAGGGVFLPTVGPGMGIPGLPVIPIDPFVARQGVQPTGGVPQDPAGAGSDEVVYLPLGPAFAQTVSAPPLVRAQELLAKAKERAGIFSIAHGIDLWAAALGPYAPQISALLMLLADSAGAGASAHQVLGAMALPVGLNPLKWFRGSKQDEAFAEANYSGTNFEGHIPADPWQTLQEEISHAGLTVDDDVLGEVFLWRTEGYAKAVRALVQHVRYFQGAGKATVAASDLEAFLVRNNIHVDGTLVRLDPSRPPYIVAVDGSKSAMTAVGMEKLARRGGVYVGRGAEVDIPFDGVAPLHAKFVQANGEYTIADLGGPGGTIVDGRQLGYALGASETSTKLSPGWHWVVFGTIPAFIWIPFDPAAVAAEAERAAIPASKVLRPAGSADAVRLPSEWTDGKIRIGRVSPNIASPPADLLGIVDDHISASHATLSRHGGRYFIEDHGSINGTFLNGFTRRIPRGRKIPLQNGDRIFIGKVELVFHGPSGSRYEEAPQAQHSERAFVRSAVNGQSQSLSALASLADGGEVVIGRGDMPESSGHVSRQHLKFKREGGRLSVMDIRKADRIQDWPTTLNGTPMEGGTWYPVEAGAEIGIVFDGDLRHRITVPGPADLEVALTNVPAWEARLVQDALRSATTIEGLQQQLTEIGTPYALALHEAIGAGLIGRAHTGIDIPAAWGVRGKVEELLKAKTAAVRAAFVGPILPLRDRSVVDVSPVQLEYLEAEETKSFSEAVKVAGSLEELADYIEYATVVPTGLFSSAKDLAEKLRSLAKGAGNDLQKIPLALGLRQKVRDLLEQHYHQQQVQSPEYGSLRPLPQDPSLRAGYERLDHMLDGIFSTARGAGRVRGRSKTYAPDELEEALYQVLERHRPLALIPRREHFREKAEEYMRAVIREADQRFPGEMSRISWSHRNPFTGESVHRGELEPEFHYAKMVLNAHAGRPIFGYPSVREQREVVDLANRHFGANTASNYPEAQQAIRTHIEGETPEFARLMEDAKPEEKLLVLETYFGNYHHRQFRDVGSALRIARRLGEMGNYREVGVTIAPERDIFYVNLSLGDMHSLSNEEHGYYYLLHTHPEVYEADDGSWMGDERGGGQGEAMTICVTSRRVCKRTLNVLFSQTDLRVMTRDAESYVPSHAQAFGPQAWYDPATRTYRSWVVHQFGMSRMDVALSPSGRTEKVTIRFGVKSSREAGMSLDNDYRRQMSRLKDEAKVLGFPLQFEEVPYQQIQSEYPY